MNRPEPRPLPKPLRVLCLFVAALLVCSLGVIVANHQPSTAGDDHGSATDAKQESTGKRKTDSGPRRYAGLEAAGIPVPGDWSQRTTAFPVDTHKDGTRTLSETRTASRCTMVPARSTPHWKRWTRCSIQTAATTNGARTCSRCSATTVPGRAIRSPTRRAGGGPSAASTPDPYARANTMTSTSTTPTPAPPTANGRARIRMPSSPSRSGRRRKPASRSRKAADRHPRRIRSRPSARRTTPCSCRWTTATGTSPSTTRPRSTRHCWTRMPTSSTPIR